jgi:hypothetical protein
MAGGSSGIAPLRPGLELGTLDVWLHNNGGTPLNIISIRIPGQGIGTVADIVQVRIAPFQDAAKAVSGGGYNSDPPVYWAAGHCRVQVFSKVSGFTLEPGANAYVWEVIKAMKPGRYVVTDNIVDYIQDHAYYHTVINTGFTGSVSDDAKPIPLDPNETRCLKPEHSVLLPWFGSRPKVLSRVSGMSPLEYGRAR